MQQIRKRQKANKVDKEVKPKLKKVKQQNGDGERHASGYTILGLLFIVTLFLIARGLAAWFNIINGK